MIKEWESSDYQDALAELNLELQQHPRNIDAYYARNELLYSLEDYEAGIKDLDIILRHNSKDALAYTLRGYGHGQLRNFQAANRRL